MCNTPDNSIEEQITCYSKTIEVTVKTKLRTFWNSIYDLRTAEEDIIANVYEKLIRLHNKYPGRKLNSAYLQKVVNSCVMNYYQHERKHFFNRAGYEREYQGYTDNGEARPHMQEYGKEDFNIARISEDSAYKDYIKVLYNEIDKLNELDRMLFILSRYQGRSIMELCQITGMNANNIKVRLSRTRARLAKAVLGDGYRPVRKVWKLA